MEGYVAPLHGRVHLESQEVFDAVVKHLLAQGKRAHGGSGCRYRTSDGLKCAVGCLVSDSEYSEEMEGRGVRGLVVCGLIPKRLEPHYQLLQELQMAHDGWLSGQISEIVASLASIAGGYSLRLDALGIKPTEV